MLLVIMVVLVLGVMIIVCLLCGCVGSCEGVVDCVK